MKLSNVASESALKPLIDQLVASNFDSIMVTEVSKDQPHMPIVYVNEAFTSLTGYSAEVVFGKSPGMLQGAETDPSVIERLREYIDAGRVFEGATYNCRKDGSNFMMHWRVAPVREDDNKPEYFVAVQRAQSESRE